MRRDTIKRTPWAGRWSSRVALFSATLVAAAFLLHRIFGMPTPVAANLVIAAILGALLSFALVGIASISVWQDGAPGTSRLVLATIISALLGAIPVALLISARDYPMINDITTDALSPPEFSALAAQRTPGTNSAAYPGRKFAESQAKFYPDVKAIEINRSREEGYDLALEAVKRLKLQIARQDPPGEEQNEPGRIEAYDRTLVFGFYDDVAIRVTGNDDSARIDFRSASRFGKSDLGRNAMRYRQFVHEFQLRLDASVPEAQAERQKTKAARASKREKAPDQKQAPRRKPQDRAQ